MKKDIIDYVIRYGSARALYLHEFTNNGSRLRIKRLENLESAYMDKILDATRNMWNKEV